jgi:hypothetical protein
MAVAKLWNGLDALPAVAVLFLDFSIDRSLQYCGATCSPCSPAQSPCWFRHCSHVGFVIAVMSVSLKAFIMCTNLGGEQCLRRWPWVSGLLASSSETQMMRAGPKAFLIAFCQAD